MSNILSRFDLARGWVGYIYFAWNRIIKSEILHFPRTGRWITHGSNRILNVSQPGAVSAHIQWVSDKVLILCGVSPRWRGVVVWFMLMYNKFLSAISVYTPPAAVSCWSIKDQCPQIIMCQAQPYGWLLRNDELARCCCCFGNLPHWKLFLL